MAVTKELLSLAVEIADALLRNGAEVYRVEDTVMHILEAYEIKDYDIYVLSNGIFASANENSDEPFSMVRHVPLGKMNLGRIAALNQLSREICSHDCSLIDAWIRLDECKSIPTYNKWIEYLFCGIGSGCFGYLFGGTPLDAVISFFAGTLLKMMLYRLEKRHTSKFLTNILGSAMVTMFSLLLYTMKLPIFYDKVIIGAIMPLVPGMALTTSIRDLFNGDYLSGAIHLIDAVLTAFCIAVGVGAIITIYQFLI